MRQAICVLLDFSWRECRQLSAWAHDLVLHSVGLECSIAGFLQWVLEIGGCKYTRGKYFKSFANSPQPFIVQRAARLQGSGVATRFGVDQHRRNSANTAPPQSTGTRRGTFKSRFQQYPLSQFRGQGPQTRFNSHPGNRELHHRLGMVQHYAPDL